ncbi:hypothetical protein O0L34_g6284 [Tuta absoluta]|nr:hypothetical protein O0L34_g6284 [Tuta absoluta]
MGMKDFFEAPKRNFLRRTKATAPPDSANPDVETTTSKYKRNFKSRTTTETPESTPKSAEGKLDVPKKEENGGIAKEENGGKRSRRPSLNSAGARNERPTRNFVRRRLGGANATTTTSTPPSSTLSSSRSPTSSSSLATRRPFRVTSRRRPGSISSTSTTTTTSEPPITERELPSTELPTSEEYLQDIGDTDFIEDPTPDERPIVNLTKTRRPLLLKDPADQKPSATNEEERKRHSKKYSSSFKQNQLDEVLRKKELASSSVEEVTTEGLPIRTTVEDNDAETALAIAAHQLLSAPPPSIPNYDEPKHTKKSNRPPTTIHEYEYTSPIYEYTRDYEFTTPNDYIQTTAGTVYDVTTRFNSAKTTYTPKSTTYTSSPFTSRVSRPTGFTAASILSTLSKDPTTEFSRIQSTANPGFPRSTESRGFTRASTSTLSGFSNVPSSLGPSTARYIGTTDKLIPVPVEDYSFTTGAYSSIGQEPSYFTREYLLESPVTKTYDDEYQYLSPTTPETTTRKVNKKITYRRKISTTIPPTVQSYVPVVTPTPRRVPNRKPFEKIPLDKEIRPKFKPVENYDYYDDGAEHLASKYGEGTKVVLHSKGTIECLDIGNFPHPSSCKKFISCARLENGSLLGWEYICPKGLSFDPVGGICNWSAGLGCSEKDL